MIVFRRSHSLICLLAAWLSPVLHLSAQPETLDLPRLRTQVAQLDDRVAELGGTGDLLDTMHFGWFDRPYARATLAVLVKTVSALQREVRMRDLGNGAIPDHTVRAMLSWSEEALKRAVAPELSDDFRPHRMRITSNSVTADETAPPVFGFVDRATATRYSDRFGDLDIMAAMGFRVYSKIPGELFGGATRDLLVQRADALGIALVTVLEKSNAPGWDAPPAALPLLGDTTLTVVPFTLRAAVQGAAASLPSPVWTPALVDPVRGESIAASIARRGLARGLRLSRRFVIDGWVEPTMGESTDDINAATAAAMWIHAIEGQSLGLLRGWRDLRDGSGSPYPSVGIDPTWIETVAHTALDLVRLGSHVAPFRTTPTLAVAIGLDAVDERDDNAWAAWIGPVWSALLRRQIRFDVVRLEANDDHAGDRYRVVFPLRRQDLGDIDSLMVRLERAMAMEGEYAHRVTAREDDDTLAADVLVRDALATRNRPCVVLVNLSNRTRRLRLHGSAALDTARDLIAGTLVEAASEHISLGPWQVRLLYPAD